MKSLTLLLLAGCGANDCYPNNFGMFTNYSILKTKTTSAGIGIDDPKGEVDPERIQKTIQNVSECISAVVSSGGISDEELAQNECFSKTFDAEIKQCIVVKVAPDWKVSECTGEQVFPCDVGNFRCEQKGQKPDQVCPCSCRGIMQAGAIVITPNLRMLPGTLTSMFTGCLSPWSGKLAACASQEMIAK